MHVYEFNKREMDSKTVAFLIQYFHDSRAYMLLNSTTHTQRKAEDKISWEKKKKQIIHSIHGNVIHSQRNTTRWESKTIRK